MPRYNYTAIDSSGKTVKGSASAENPYAARKQIRAKNIHPTSVEAVDEKEKKHFLLSLIPRGSKTQIVDFTKQLSILLDAGIKLTEALSVLTKQISDTKFRNAVADIRDRVVTGESFTDTLNDYSDYFDIIYVSMVRVGEVTGNLSASLTTIAKFMEKRQRVESKIITAMIYPAFIFVLGIGAVIFLTTFVIPKIVVQIQKTGQELPLVTKGLMTFSYIMLHWWFVVIAVVAIIVWSVKRFLATERGAYLLDKTLLSLPVFGPLIKQRVVARFSSTLSTLLGSGLSMADSLRVVAEVTGNTILRKAVAQARERILSGADIATPLRESGIIDPATAHMVSVGEKSGELEKMLQTISEHLESSTDIVIERLSAALEPLIIIIMALFVGIIAYATLLPILRFSAGQF